MSDVKGIDQLKEHLERAREHLSSTNETIKKYTGREPNSLRPNFRPIDSEAAGRRMLSNALKRGISSTADDGPMQKNSRGIGSNDIGSKVIGVAYSRFETRRRERDVHDRLGPAPRSTIGSWNNDNRDRDRDRDRDRRRNQSKEEEIKERVRRLDEMDDDDEPRRRRPITISSSITRKVNDDQFDNDDVRPLQSRLQTTASVVRVPEQRSREDAINEMNSLMKSDKERNRRIFSGLLLNTLRNFDTHASRADDVAKRRRTVEARIEEREAEEKEDLRRERADLFRARRDNQRMVRRIEQKIRSVDAFEAWKKEFEKQKFFIRTRARPHIYYLPKVMDSTSERRLARTAKEVDNQIADRRAKMEEEVKQLIEEEPQDPNQLLEETNRSRLQQLSRTDESNAGAGADTATADPQQPDFDDMTAGTLQEPTVAEEDSSRLEVSVYVGEEEEEEEDNEEEEKAPSDSSNAKPKGEQREEEGADEAGGGERKGSVLDEDVSQMPVVVEVHIADEDIPLPPCPPPPQQRQQQQQLRSVAAVAMETSSKSERSAAEEDFTRSKEKSSRRSRRD